MKKIDFLVIQSTETGEGISVTPQEIVMVHTSDLRQGGMGWNRPGIDILIQPDGTIDTLISDANITDVDLWGFSEGKEGINGVFKTIAFVGGRTEKETKSKDTRTNEQLRTLEILIGYYTLNFPNIQVLGFDEAPHKSGSENPGFDVAIYLEEIGVEEKNIYKKLKD
ncbi:hypothetical protein [Aquimarina pacifica]|uniref:hypothetical protein n=1 Tax=Aquimarina pacifica TaxID=1296415 RepID=UPI00047039E0|nr:hypothetical protein [Aquimarina pacifica]